VRKKEAGIAYLATAVPDGVGVCRVALVPVRALRNFAQQVCGCVVELRITDGIAHQPPALTSCTPTHTLTEQEPCSPQRARATGSARVARASL
jgi:hypothetical protein